jgi:DNA gyrase/topoisomerase IV subunit B
MKMEMVFTYDTTLDNGFEYELSFNNTCPTEGGKHLEGALDGIVKFFKEYMNKIYLANVKTKEKLVCSINDVKQGLKLVISTFHLYAMYTGQSKEILSNEDIFPFVSQTVYAGLNQYFQQNNGELQKLCKYFRTIIELRMKQDKDRVKLSNSFKASILSGYPEKFKKPNIKKGFELIIVEGDSAFGSAENSRDNLTQGIIPVRGKLPNAFEKTQKEMFENEEVASIFQIIDGGYGKDFDISKVKVSKVIFMADADPDGKHILSLLLRLFALYARPLLEAGMVYAAIPPLYGIPIGKNDYKYFIDKTDYIKYIQQKFSSQNKLTDIKGKALASKDIVAILSRTEYYAGILESTAANYAMDPFLLECILINQGTSFTTFKKNIQKQYRFMDVTQTNGVYVLDGLAADKKHTVFVDNRLLNQCTLLMKYLRENQNYYILNDQLVSLYGLRLAFSKYEPPSLSRFKGLGEMDPEMLAKSTLRPDGDRFLIRYTFKDVERELREMRAINSSKDVLLKDLIVDKHDVY